MTPGDVMAQHQALNLGDAWQKVTSPVLVMRGTADTIMSDADAHAIAEIPGGDHLLSVKGKLADEVAPTMMKWMREQLAR